MLLHHYSIRHYFSLTTIYEHRINVFFPLIVFVTLEFTSICKTKSDEESKEKCHEEKNPFINQDVEKNTVICEQGKLSNR